MYSFSNFEYDALSAAILKLNKPIFKANKKTEFSLAPFHWSQLLSHGSSFSFEQVFHNTVYGPVDFPLLISHISKTIGFDVSYVLKICKGTEFLKSIPKTPRNKPFCYYLKYYQGVFIMEFFGVDDNLSCILFGDKDVVDKKITKRIEY